MLPPVTKMLLTANVAVYLLQFVLGDILVIWFGLWPFHTPSAIGAGFLPWQVLTYGFLHGSLMHIGFNMLALYMFGGQIEQVFGPRRFLIYYLGCVLSAALAQLVIQSLTASPPFPTVGASGGVFGLLLAYGLFFPRRIVMLIFPPIPMPAWLFVTLYGLVELYLGVTGTQAGVAHFAHLGGMLGGYILIRQWRRRPPDQH
ncbi:MAG: rhomboid family intramembrane serine protease [Betaproteobacteria bacterium]|jgi:membrane associated rhomboid family serine protease|nr:rhomboid family intramembrane serine protease [Betaproteobacteria bacterium]MDH5342119.1 rhomboid family intramembrane serine protease [Betaproteobacteria bacterium]